MSAEKSEEGLSDPRRTFGAEAVHADTLTPGRPPSTSLDHAVVSTAAPVRGSPPYEGFGALDRDDERSRPPAAGARRPSKK